MFSYLDDELVVHAICKVFYIMAAVSLYKEFIHSKITMAGDVVPYYIVTALVPTLKYNCVLLLWGNSVVTMEYSHSYSVGVPA